MTSQKQSKYTQGKMSVKLPGYVVQLHFKVGSGAAQVMHAGTQQV